MAWEHHPPRACPRQLRNGSTLVNRCGGRMVFGVNRKLIMPLALMVVFALSRVPGMLPQNFSAAYALLFCAGVYFSGKSAWWVPLTTLLVTDFLLDLYYLHLGWHVFTLPTLKYQLINYLA